MKSVLIMSCDTCAPRIAESIARGLESQGKKAAILAPVASCKEEACGNSVCERQAAQWIAQGKRDQLISLLIDRQGSGCRRDSSDQGVGCASLCL